MKRIMLLPLITLLFSCGGGGQPGKYEKAIADYVQTDSRGTKLDLKFKVEKLEEIQKITVADSIKIVTDAFNADKEKQIASLEKTISLYTSQIEKEKVARRPSQTMINSYQSDIDKTNSRINSIRETRPAELEKYTGRDTGEILAIVVRCTYSADEPLTNKKVTETFDFYLSPDGTKCYSQKGVR